MMPKKQKAHELLKAQFEKKRAKNEKFSLRLLAQKLDLSPAFVSNVLSGKRELPLQRARDFGRLLGMDAFATRKLVRALVLEQNLDQETAGDISLDPQDLEIPVGELPSDKYLEAHPKNHSVLEQWYYLPMLELIACEDFRADPDWIADRLGLKREVAEKAWARLVAMGCVGKVDGRWRKEGQKILFPAAKTDPLIQKYHLFLLEKSMQELRERGTEEDFQRRLIMSISTTANPEKVRQAKKYLEEALIKAADMLDEGPRGEVYHLGLQCFPLTRSPKGDRP
jgi:uncharacterized protein (TIGR02147 family)